MRTSASLARVFRTGFWLCDFFVRTGEHAATQLHNL